MTAPVLEPNGRLDLENRAAVALRLLDEAADALAELHSEAEEAIAAEASAKHACANEFTAQADRQFTRGAKALAHVRHFVEAVETDALLARATGGAK